MHGKQPDRPSRAWRFASRAKTCRGWKQAVGGRIPKVTALKNRQPETLPVVLTASYGSLLWQATHRSKAIAAVDKEARTELNRTRYVRVLKGGKRHV